MGIFEVALAITGTIILPVTFFVIKGINKKIELIEQRQFNLQGTIVTKEELDSVESRLRMFVDEKVSMIHTQIEVIKNILIFNRENPRDNS